MQGYSWLTCSKQPRLIDSRTGVVNTSSTVDDDDDELCWQRDRLAVAKSSIFSLFGTNLIFGDTKFPYNIVWDKQKEASMPKRSPVQSFRYNTGLWQTDRRTEERTHDDSKYRASIASRGKNSIVNAMPKYR